MAAWGLYGIEIGTTSTSIGSGKRNTRSIVNMLNRNRGERGSAAQLCSFALSGYKDWFLPSMDELDLMYKNLKEKGLGGFSDDSYWSSSEYFGETNGARFQSFGDGRQSGTEYRGSSCSVRAVRAF